MSENVTVQPNEPQPSFLPAVTFTDRVAARDAYLSLCEHSRFLANRAMHAAKDPDVTADGFEAIKARAERINRLASVVFEEWMRLDSEANA